MRQVVRIVVGTCVLVLGSANLALAQKTTLPQGRPFQILQDAIDAVAANIDASIAALQAKVTALSGRVDTVEQYNTVQDQLIGALQGNVVLLQQKMVNVELSVTNLTTWNNTQDALLAQLQSRVSTLESIATSHGNSLQDLFNLNQAQQNHLNAIQTNLNFLNSQNMIVQGQITGLQSQITNQQTQINGVTTTNTAQQNQLNLLFGVQSVLQSEIDGLGAVLGPLNLAYGVTRGQLAAGCPQGQYIRQVIPSAPVICEVDAGLQTVSTSVSASNVIGPFTVASVAVSCPPAPPGQPAFLATGGGHAIASGLNLVASNPTGPTTWQITVTNPTNNTFGFAAIANCVRHVTQ